MSLDNVVQLFDNVKLLYLCGKVLDELYRQRIDKSQLQVACLVAQSFLCVFICNAGGDNAYLITVHLNGVERAVLSIFGELFQSLLNNNMALDGICGHHNVLADILLILADVVRNSLALLNNALGVGNSCGKAQDNGSIELFRKLIRHLCKFLALARVGRLHHSHL